MSPFSNPIQAQPKFYRTRDEFYWPCISGEDWPPVLDATVIYSGRSGLACLDATGVGTVTLQQAIWGRLSRVSPSSPLTNVLHVQLKLMKITNIAGQTSFRTIGVTNSTGVLQNGGFDITIPADVAAAWILHSRTGGETTSTNFAAPALNIWTACEVIISTASVVFKMADVVVATHPGFSLTTFDSNPFSVTKVIQSLDSIGSIALTQLRLFWETS